MNGNEWISAGAGVGCGRRKKNAPSLRSFDDSDACGAAHCIRWSKEIERADCFLGGLQKLDGSCLLLYTAGQTC